MEERKQKEAKFHDQLRDRSRRKDRLRQEHLTSNEKFYSVIRSSQTFVNGWLLERCRNGRVLDYCCGDGETSIFLAKNGAEVIGIDISSTSINNAKKSAIQESVDKNTSFFVMDAENLGFEDNWFDLIVCNGVLHHLNIRKAYPELARVLRPDGKIICDEPLIHNPVFQLYRKLTPHLRTKWEAEHLLSKDDIRSARGCFSGVEINFFHLATLGAVPFRNTPVFDVILSVLETLDRVLLKSPILKWQAWQAVFVLSEPKKRYLC